MERRGKGGEEKKGGRTQQEHVFPLSTCRVYPCVSAAGAAPREFNSIFNLPKPLYANSGYRRRVFLDFFLPFPHASRLTLPPLPLPPPPGSHPSARPSFIRTSPWHRASRHSSSPSESGHAFSPLLAAFYECRVANLRNGPE